MVGLVFNRDPAIVVALVNNDTPAIASSQFRNTPYPECGSSNTLRCDQHHPWEIVDGDRHFLAGTVLLTHLGALFIVPVLLSIGLK